MNIELSDQNSIKSFVKSSFHQDIDKFDKLNDQDKAAQSTKSVLLSGLVIWS